jgi:hypothetical protein
MVIWVTQDLVEQVKEFRKDMLQQTDIQVCTIEDYRLYQYIDQFDDIIEYNKTRKWLHGDAPHAIEHTIPMYNLVVNNKVDFVYKTRQLHPNAEYYVWIDAGYTHTTIDFKGKHVDVQQLPPNPVYINRLWEFQFETDWKKFQEDHWPLDVVDGGFVAFRSNIVEEFHEKYYQLIDEAMQLRILDDDQFFMTMLFVRYPSLFSMQEDWMKKPGEWFDAANRYIHKKKCDGCHMCSYEDCLCKQCPCKCCCENCEYYGSECICCGGYAEDFILCGKCGLTSIRCERYGCPVVQLYVKNGFEYTSI